MKARWNCSRGELEALVEQHSKRYLKDKTARSRRRIGLNRVLDWLEQADGSTWQECWERVGETSDDWLTDIRAVTRTDRVRVSVALQTLMLEGVIRPSYDWMLRMPQHRMYEKLRATDYEKEAFDKTLASAEEIGASGATVKQAEIVLSKVVLHTGKRLAEITTEDLLEYARAVAATGRNVSGLRVAHQLLRSAGYINEPPLAHGYAARLNKPSVRKLVDSYGIECGEVRDLLVMYLEERVPGLDYQSAQQLTTRLAKMFWRDIELHHPGIDSIDLPRDVIDAWKKRHELLPDGRMRKNFGELLMMVRGFYLDLLQLASEDPGRWGAYACSSPISASELRRHGKELLHRRARMHERIRTLAPVLPHLVESVHRHLGFSRRLLDTAQKCSVGECFEIDGRKFQRLESPRANFIIRFGVKSIMVREIDTPDTPVFNCHDVEEEAFWTWAVVEVLRLTGVRVEELVELTHLSIHRYEMPDGQLVLLLQITPSKRDRERVMPVCAELAHVLAEIINRIRDRKDDVPLVERYDPLEKTMSRSLPYLFQRRWRSQGAVMSSDTVGALLKRASGRAGLKDKQGQPIYFTPHDFRRLFASEAVNGGLPIHIAAKLLGHLDLNTTRGYVAVYPQEVIRQYQTHLSRRRAFRPAAEYREPSEEEWEEFDKHFRRRKMALGDCYRPYGTNCPHEHACVRCPMLRVDPGQLPRLIQIENNTVDLLGEARENGWEGEVTGLEDTLRHIQEKKAQVARISGREQKAEAALLDGA